MKELTYHHDGLGLTELCRVLVVDDPHPVNGAHHAYSLLRALSPEEQAGFASHNPGLPPAVALEVGSIQFQRGPRNVDDSTPGTLDGAVLAVLIHRFECFQAGPFGSAENEEVLEHLRAALAAILARAKERAGRGVLGTNAK